MSKTILRQQALQEFLSVKGYATIEELARRFEVTPQTVRKDINKLASAGSIQRFHGGAGILAEIRGLPSEPRSAPCLEEKRRVGNLLAEQIPNNASLCINFGSTMEEVAWALLEHRKLRIVTNSLNVAAICARNPSFEVVIACGVVRHQDNGIVGTSVEQFIREFRVDYGIFGGVGIDELGNLLDKDYREVLMARTVIECSRQVFLVTNSNAFGQTAMVRIAHLSDVHAVFTCGPLDTRWESLIREAGPQLFIA